ncbi:hypothetical protein D3C81_1023180 [compost metagenome]
MAVAVVDLLEQIDIQEADRQGLPVQARFQQVLLQLAQAGTPIRQAGQHVGIGQLAHFIALLAHVAKAAVERISRHHQEPRHHQLRRLDPVFDQQPVPGNVGQHQHQQRHHGDDAVHDVVIATSQRQEANAQCDHAGHGEQGVQRNRRRCQQVV